MYDELVKQCRDCIDSLCGECKYEHLQKPGNFVLCMNTLLGEAADAMEDMNRTLDALEADNDSPCEQLEELQKRVLLTPIDSYEGLKRKYIVLKADTGEDVPDCFVLRPAKDKAAVEALWAYAKATDNDLLAADIYRWVGPLPEPPKEGT